MPSPTSHSHSPRSRESGRNPLSALMFWMKRVPFSNAQGQARPTQVMARGVLVGRAEGAALLGYKPGCAQQEGREERPSIMGLGVSTVTFGRTDLPDMAPLAPQSRPIAHS